MYLNILEMCKNITWDKYNIKFWKKKHSVQDNTRKAHRKFQLSTSKNAEVMNIYLWSCFFFTCVSLTISCDASRMRWKATVSKFYLHVRFVNVLSCCWVLLHVLTSKVISVVSDIEREKSNKFLSEGLISAWGTFTSRKSTTRDPRLYFPSEGSHTQDFYALKKIHRPRPRSNPRTSDPEASMITTGPLGRLKRIEWHMPKSWTL